MAKHCTIHPDTELVVVEYCPACRGTAGGTKAAEGMTAAQRSQRARKGARAMWAKAKAKAKGKKKK